MKTIKETTLESLIQTILSTISFPCTWNADAYAVETSVDRAELIDSLLETPAWQVTDEKSLPCAADMLDIDQEAADIYLFFTNGHVTFAIEEYNYVDTPLRVDDNTIVGFYISGGGGNRRKVEFLGESKISDYVGNLFSPTIFDDNREDMKDDTSPEAMWTDFNGREIISNADIVSGIGRIDIDGDYNTVYTKRLKDIDATDESEIYAIANEPSAYAFAAYLMIHNSIAPSKLC